MPIMIKFKNRYQKSMGQSKTKNLKEERKETNYLIWLMKHLFQPYGIHR